MLLEKVFKSKRNFSFNIPLSHIFGFAEYKKVIYGQKHTLTLTRGADTQIQLSSEYLAGMRSLIKQKVTIPISFKARSCEQITLTQTQNYTWRLSVTGGVEKPRYIIIAFQTAKSDDQEQNPAIFDNLQLENAYVTLNSERFPTNDIITDFATNDYVKLYDMFDSFKKEYSS